MILNTTVSVCSYEFRPTTYSGVYFIIEPITERLLEKDYNTDATPNLVYGTKIEVVHVNAHFSLQRIVNFLKNETCNTRLMILCGLFSLASNLDAKLFIGSGSMVGPHREKAVAVLYVQKCAKIEARFADFSYCTKNFQHFWAMIQSHRFRDEKYTWSSKPIFSSCFNAF